MNENIQVEVVYALPDKQTVLCIDITSNTDIETAIKMSGILDKFPQIDLDKNVVGVFGQKARLTDLLHDGDRIEIYRPLTADPREIRRKRAMRQ